MNKDTFEGNWKQFKGKVKEEWGKLTDDDLDIVEGQRDQLAGRLQERYGLTRMQRKGRSKSLRSATLPKQHRDSPLMDSFNQARQSPGLPRLH